MYYIEDPLSVYLSVFLFVLFLNYYAPLDSLTLFSYGSADLAVEDDHVYVVNGADDGNEIGVYYMALRLDGCSFRVAHPRTILFNKSSILSAKFYHPNRKQNV